MQVQSASLFPLDVYVFARIYWYIITSFTVGQSPVVGSSIKHNSLKPSGHTNCTKSLNKCETNRPGWSNFCLNAADENFHVRNTN